MKRFFFFVSVLATVASIGEIQANADGVCDPSGWCRLHFNLRNRPYSVVFIKPIDQYGQFRRLWMRADDFTDGITIDCGRAMVSEQNGTGAFFPATRGTVSWEIYESICLGQNARLGFPPGTGSNAWPPPPAVQPGGYGEGVQPPMQPYGPPPSQQGGNGGADQAPNQQRIAPSPLRLILEQLIK